MKSSTTQYFVMSTTKQEKVCFGTIKWLTSVRRLRMTDFLTLWVYEKEDNTRIDLGIGFNIYVWNNIYPQY